MRLEGLDRDRVMVWALAATVTILLLILFRRKPIWILWVALVGLAIRPEILLDQPAYDSGVGIQQLLLLVAFLANGVRYGIRFERNWPLFVLAMILFCNFTVAELHQSMTLEKMMAGVLLFALPWMPTNIVFAPGSRRACGLVISLLPTMSVLVGLLTGMDPTLTSTDGGSLPRLIGAAGDAGLLGVLALIGFVVAMHESNRAGRPWAGPLALINLIVVVLAGSRMAVLASLAYFLTYAMLSPSARHRWRRHKRAMAAAAIAVGGVGVATLPTLLARIDAGVAGGFDLSGRDQIWDFYWQEVLLGPFFGRGFGAGEIARFENLHPLRNSPHSEYLHVLLIGGWTGLALMAIAVAAWYTRLMRKVGDSDRIFLLALIPAWLLLCSTEDFITYAGALPLYVYVGMTLTRRTHRAMRPSEPRVPNQVTPPENERERVQITTGIRTMLDGAPAPNTAGDRAT